MATATLGSGTPWFEPARQPASTDRLLLHALDGCLGELEDAHERGELRVSPRLARRLEQRIPWLTPGVLLADAIEGVFKQQERYLQAEADEPDGAWSLGCSSDDHQTGVEAATIVPISAEASLVEPIGEQEARALTERIKAQLHDVCMLLLEAHKRRAWKVLGYRTWERYVREEFGLSRSRSYQLLDQGRVLRAIQGAVGMPVELTVDAALEIKVQLPEVIDEIRVRTVAGDSEDRVRQVVTEVVQTKRRQIAAVREHAEPRSTSHVPPDGRGGMSAARVGSELEQLDATQTQTRTLELVIEFLAGLPPPANVIDRLSGEDEPQLRSLERAVQWLTEFAAQYIRA